MPIRTGIEKLNNLFKGNSGALSDAITSAVSVAPELLHAAAPDNYELYRMAIQIIDVDVVGSAPAVVSEFNFDVMPESLDVKHEFMTQVQPTLTSNFISDSDKQLPAEFQITGVFGRKHRLIVNLKSESLKDKVAIVTGYGMVKRLEKILLLSKKASERGVPYRTYLINQAFNSSIRVEIKSMTFNQSISRNGIWVYTLNFVKVSDDYSLAKQKSLTDNLFNLANKSASFFVSNAVDNTMAFLSKYV